MKGRTDGQTDCHNNQPANVPTVKPKQQLNNHQLHTYVYMYERKLKRKQEKQRRMMIIQKQIQGTQQRKRLKIIY